MIEISEKKCNKLPGLTSLFVSFDYKPATVEIIKQRQNAIYDAKNKIWELPITELSALLDQLCFVDEIHLKLKKDKAQQVTEKPKLSKFKTKPFQYQVEGIEYGTTHDKWLLLDECGLGKSLSALYVAQELKRLKGIKHCLIVCCVNSLKFNWKEEIAKHTNLSCTILGERQTKTGRTVIDGVPQRIEQLKHPIKEFFVITNIESLRNDEITKLINKGKNQFDMVIVDEIHLATNPKSDQGHNLLKLTTPKYKMAMTGTLIVSNPFNCYLPLKFIDAEHGTFTNFRYYYGNYGGKFHNDLLGYKNVEILQDQIQQYQLRRLKNLLDLPDKQIVHELLEMEPKQQKFYENVKQGIIDQVDKVKISTANLLAMVARLRQVTACPTYLTTENIPCAKIDRCVDLAEQILSNGTSKVVIFATFKETVALIQERLKQYQPIIATGDISDDVVDKGKKEFQTNPNVRVFLGTWQRAGTGLTLTAAQDLIFVDTPWSQAQCKQVEDRIHRIGQKQPAIIHYLWTKDSVDERVKQIVEDKGLVGDYIIDEKNPPPEFVDRLRQLIVDLQ